MFPSLTVLPLPDLGTSIGVDGDEIEEADNRDQSLSFSNHTSRLISQNVGECAILLEQ